MGAPAATCQREIGYHRGMKWLVALVLIAACGGRPPVPKRGVVEQDLGEWKFRRFQPVLDVEVWVEDNKAEAFTASYVREEAEKRGRIDDKDLVNVFVTRYVRDEGVLREAVKFARRLASEGGYTVDEGKVGGVRAVTITGNHEAWVMWASKLHVVKVGGRNLDRVPEGMVESYGDRYPSVFPRTVLEGPLPGNEPVIEKREGEEEQPYDPNNPRPDWDKYDADEADQKIEDAKQRRDREERGEDPDDDSDDDKDAGDGKRKDKR